MKFWMVAVLVAFIGSTVGCESNPGNIEPPTKEEVEQDPAVKDNVADGV